MVSERRPRPCSLPVQEMADGCLLAMVIPVFNDQPGLRASLDSLRAARRPAGMITIVVDDGSASPVAAVDGDQGIGLTIVRLGENQGIERALNAGLAEARRCGAKYIARLDAGDTIAPERLDSQIQVLEQNPDIGLVGSSARFVDETGRCLFVFRAPETDAAIRRRMHINSCILHPTAMLRESVLARVGDYSTDYPAAEDYEFFCRVLGHCKAACLPDALVTKVLSAGSISRLRRRTQLASRLRIQWRFFDKQELASHLGLALTLALFLIPERLVLALKRFLGHSRY